MPDASPQRLALFGGTFDPIHNGHLDLVELAKQEGEIDRVAFIPCARSPFKSDAAIASAEQRIALLQLAIAERGWEKWASVSRFEIDRDPPSYSWRTAAHFRENVAPETELSWILGGDQWEQLDHWAEPEKLRQWLRFIVVTRKGSRLHPRDGWRASFLEFEHPASATAIREGRGQSDWLPESVAAYCQEHGLYGFS